MTEQALQGFFVGWPNAPAPHTHLKVLANSDEVVLAIDSASGHVVGFVTALTDRTFAACITFLEVLPAYRRRGIGKELVRRLLTRLDGLYMVDVSCDPEMESFYGLFGMERGGGMRARRYGQQAGHNGKG